MPEMKNEEKIDTESEGCYTRCDVWLVEWERWGEKKRKKKHVKTTRLEMKGPIKQSKYRKRLGQKRRDGKAEERKRYIQRFV